MKITVRTTGAIRPNRPLTPLEVANMLRDYVGKVIEVDVDPSITVQALADIVDRSMGINPASTFDEVIMEHNIALDNSKTLEEQGVQEGDELSYRFYINMTN
jgi:hypothetical protein